MFWRAFLRNLKVKWHEIGLSCSLFQSIIYIYNTFMEGQCGQGQGQVFRIARLDYALRLSILIYAAAEDPGALACVGSTCAIFGEFLVGHHECKLQFSAWTAFTLISHSFSVSRAGHIQSHCSTCHVIMFKLIDYDPRFAVSLCTWRSCNPGEGNVINCTWGILCRKGFQRAGETGDIGQQVGASWCKIQQVVLVCMMGQHHHHSKHVVCKYCTMVLMVWHGMIWHYAEYYR